MRAGLAVSVVAAAINPATAFAQSRLKYEALMREVQAKRAYVTNNFIKWPAGPGGCIAPLFPPDGFYGDSLTTAQKLALAQALYDVHSHDAYPTVWYQPYLSEKAYTLTCLDPLTLYVTSEVEFDPCQWGDGLSGPYTSSPTGDGSSWCIQLEKYLSHVSAFKTTPRVSDGQSCFFVGPDYPDDNCHDLGSDAAFSAGVDADPEQPRCQRWGGRIRFDLAAHPDISGEVFGNVIDNEWYLDTHYCMPEIPTCYADASGSMGAGFASLGFSVHGGSSITNATLYAGPGCCGGDANWQFQAWGILTPDWTSRSKPSPSSCSSCSGGDGPLQVQSECLGDAVVVNLGSGENGHGGARVVVATRPYATPHASTLKPISYEIQYEGSDWSASSNIITLPYQKGWVKCSTSGDSSATIELFPSGYSGSLPLRSVVITRTIGSTPDFLDGGASASGMHIEIAEWRRNTAGTALEQFRSQAADSVGGHYGSTVGSSADGSTHRQWTTTAFEGTTQISSEFTSGNDPTALASKITTKLERVAGAPRTTARSVYADPSASPTNTADKDKILTTTWTYYDDPSQLSYAKVKHESRPDGGWTHFEYDSATGLVSKTVEGFLDHVYDPAHVTDSEAQNIVTTYEYPSLTSLSIGTSDNWWGLPHSSGTATVGAVKRTIVMYPKFDSSTSTWSGAVVRCSYDLVLVESSSVHVSWHIDCADPAAAATATPATFFAGSSGVLTSNGKVPYLGDNIVSVTQSTNSGGVWRTTLSLSSDGRLSRYTENGSQVTTLSGWPAETGSQTNKLWDLNKYYKHVTTFGSDGMRTETDYEVISSVERTVARSIESYPDAFGRATRIDYLDGTTESMSYDCCGLATRTDRDGNTTNYTHDSLGRVVTEFRTLQNGHGLTTLYTYDAEGRTTKVTRQSDQSGVPEAITDITTYDLAGRVTDTTSNGVRTTYAYSHDWTTSGTLRVLSSKVTTMNPNYSTTNAVWQSTYPDGRAKETGDDVSCRTRQEYRIATVSSADRFIARSIKLGGSGETTEWVESVQDPLGRTERTRVPFGTEETDFYESRNYYGGRGKLVKQVDMDGVVTLFADGWDNTNHVEYSTTAIDLDSNITNGTDNRNDTIDVGSSGSGNEAYDRVTRTERSVVDLGSGVYAHRTTTKQLSDSAGTWQPLSTTDVIIATGTTLNPAPEKTVEYRGDSSSTLKVTTTITHKADGVSGRSRTVIINPDTTSTETTSLYGVVKTERTLDSTTPTAVEMLKREYTYDDHGRLSTVTDLDPAGGTNNPVTTYTYEDFATGDNPSADRIASITQTSGSGSPTSLIAGFEYDELGRRKVVHLPDYPTDSTKKVTTTYDAAGRVATIRGARTYPVDYTYDSQGRMLTLTTYQTESGTTVGNPATTKWKYNPYRGWLDEKQYTTPGSTTGNAEADTGPSYTYTHGGKLATRAWRRSIPSSSTTRATTTYTYNEAGDLSKIEYNDGITPTVGFDYDRRGRTNRITDQAGTRNFTFDAFDRVTKEEFPDGLFIHLRQDLTYSSIGQRTSLDYRQQSGSTTTELSNRGFGYDSLGRLSRFWMMANVSGTWKSQFDANYAFETKGTRVSSHTIRNLGAISITGGHDGIPPTTSSSDVAAGVRSYDGLGRLTGLQWTASVGTASGHDLENYSYAYNTANQRTSQTVTSYQASTASWNRPDYRWDFAYDAYGQLTGANKVWTDPNPDMDVLGQNFGYAFDAIGNRTSATMGGSSPYATWTYTRDRLNRYSQRTVPRTFDFEGFSTSNPAYVKIASDGSGSGVAGDRQPVTSGTGAGPYFHRIVNPFPDGDNAGTASGAASIPYFVPSSPEYYSYDLDGNLTSDGRSIYTYDGENRLIQVDLQGSLYGMSPLTFDGSWRYEYDYMGRRIRKYRQTMSGGESMMMSSSESTSTTSSLTEGGSESDGIVDETKFMYDGWLLTLELNANSVVQRSYFYGLDLSGSMQGAGGIGGLLFQGSSGTPTTSNTRWFSHDPQGNVTNLRSLSDDSRWVSIEYGPFGERLTASSTNLDQFKLRFSGKYFDEETGLSYFGYRYYSANTGRWLSRDRAAESCSQNLTAYVSNIPNVLVDPHGLWEVEGTFTASHAFVKATCGDSFSDLAFLLTGHRSAAADKMPYISERGSAGDLINVAPLLAVLEDRIREKVLKAADNWTGLYPNGSTTGSRAQEHAIAYPVNAIDMPPEAIASYFDRSPNMFAYCTAASLLVLNKGLIDATDNSDIGNYAYIFGTTQSSNQFIKRRDVMDEGALKPGDRTHFKPGMASLDASRPDLNGEWTIYRGNSRYFGHGVGADVSRTEVFDTLDKWTESKGAYQALTADGAQFFDIPKLGQRILEKRLKYREVSININSNFNRR